MSSILQRFCLVLALKNTNTLLSRLNPSCFLKNQILSVCCFIKINNTYFLRALIKILKN